jgi:LacI family transcriptional regulator, galactose operon repressor
VNSPNPVRLQDIADRAGVSKATVSLALRNHSSIPPTTRKRIQDLARELGYQPNPLVSALMTYQRTTKVQRAKHLTLAIVVNFSHNDRWQYYLSDDLISAAAAQAGRHGYQLEEFWLGDLKISPQRLSAILYQRSIPGVIVAPLPAARGHLNMEWNHFSPVAIGYSLLKPTLHRVTTDRFKAMRLAVRRLRQMRYVRIGLAMHSNQDTRVNHQWGAAFLWEQKQIPSSEQTTPFLVEERDWNERGFAKWFERNQPEVVLGYDPSIVDWLKKLGRKVPEDVGFAHLWNADRSGRFAGLYHDPPAIGAAAVDFLVGMIHRNERGIPPAPQTLLLDATWQDGATVRRRPKLERTASTT